MFPRDNIRKTLTVMHNTVFEHSDILSFALLACIILYINGTQFRCSVFTFVQYIIQKISVSQEYNCVGYRMLQRNGANSLLQGS